MRRRISVAADLNGLIEALAGTRRLLIVTHDNPDPDALVSACALARLVGAVLGEVRCRIVCDGIVGRAENRTLKRELRIKLYPSARLNWDKWPRVALVDSQPGTGNNCLPARRTPDVVLDHHPLRKKGRGRFVDVRPELGACATILAEYLRLAQVNIGEKLAAGLCYAIASETQDLARDAAQEDVNAYANLYLTADKRMLGRVLHPRLKHSYFATLTRALLAAFSYGNIVGSHLGEVDHPDSVSMVADLLLRHERNTWAIVTGVWRDTLYVSLRTISRRAHTGRLLQQILPSGSRAGGHDRYAGGQIPLRGRVGAEVAAIQDEVVNRLIEHVRRRREVTLRPLISPEELGRALPVPAGDRSQGD